MAEYREALARPKMNIRKGLRRPLLQLVKSHAHSVPPARADYLVTGNQRHFPKFWKKTKMITSREFIGIVAPHLLS